MSFQEIGSRIRKARQSAGLSQEAFAARLGSSRRSVIRWESGESKPGPETLQRIAEATETPVQCFFGEEAT